MNIKNIFTGVAVATLAVSISAGAAEFKPASVRALGMGGSNVASTNDVDATYWNPAAYGFFGEDSADMKAVDNNGSVDKAYGLGINALGGLFLYGSFPDNFNNALVTTLPILNLTDGLNIVEIKDVIRFGNEMNLFDPAEGGQDLSVDASLGARVFNYGLGIRTSLDVHSSMYIDNANVGIGTTLTNELSNAFASALGASSTTSDFMVNIDTLNTTAANPAAQAIATAQGITLPTYATYFNAAERNSLSTSLQNQHGLTVDQAASVVMGYETMVTADPYTATADKQQTMDNLLAIYDASGDATLNATKVSAVGVALTEANFTYGYAVNEALSMGIVLKYLQADMIKGGTDGVGANIKIETEVLDSVSGFGVDLGLMYRIPQWQLGLVVKNVNAPSFEFNDGFVYDILPQAKLGAAWMPVETFTLEVGYDLTENDGMVAGAGSQYWNAGMEWNAWNVLAIRLGAFENLAQKDVGLVQTLGLGLNLWAARIDLAAAQSAKTVELDGTNVPVYVQLSLALNIDF